MKTIPVRNIYYLLLYAWDRLEEGMRADVGIEGETDLVNLFARVLLRAFREVRVLGLNRKYLAVEEEQRVIRGKVRIASSLKLGSMRLGRLVCEFDELSNDTLPNQILKACLVLLTRTENLSPLLDAEIRKVLPYFHSVPPLELEERVFKHHDVRNCRGVYAFLMNLCRMIFLGLVPALGDFEFSFQSFLRDEKEMRRVFEAFVRNFFRIEQDRFSVRRERLTWDGTSSSEEAALLLPGMETDVSLLSPQRHIIIETKYVPELLTVGRFGGEKLRSNHLYQLAAYLRNATQESKIVPEGVLLYPAVSTVAFEAKYNIWGHSLSIRTLNLDRTWPEIAADLLSLCAG